MISLLFKLYSTCKMKKSAVGVPGKFLIQPKPGAAADSRLLLYAKVPPFLKKILLQSNQTLA